MRPAVRVARLRKPDANVLSFDEAVFQLDRHSVESVEGVAVRDMS
jgi:hypothetical protein